MGKQTLTHPFDAKILVAPMVVGLEDEFLLAELLEALAGRIVPQVAVRLTASDAEQALIEAVITGHRHILLVSDVQVDAAMPDKGQSLSDSLCQRALSGELFGGAPVCVQIIRMSGNADLQVQYAVRKDAAFIPKPFMPAEFEQVLGEAAARVTNMSSPSWLN